MAYGLKPVYHLEGGVVRANEYTIASNYSTALFTGDPLQIAADGTVQLAAPNSSTQNIGVFGGVYYTAADGTPVFSKTWNTPTGATNIRALVFDDPNIVFMVEADNVGSALTQAAVGGNADLASGSGNSLLGVSGWYFDSSGGVASTAAQMKVIGVANRDFLWAGVGVPQDILVIFNEHQFKLTTGV